MINYISHKKSKQIVNGLPKLPTSDQLKEGEIAINYANGYETLSIKNSDNEITTFSSTEQIEKYVDTKLGSGFTGNNSSNTVTSVIEENEKITSASLNELNDRKLDASAYTPTDLSDYYKKEETSGKTEIATALNSKANTSDLSNYYKKTETSGKTELDAAFGKKANTSDLTAHTGNTTAHITSDERMKWNGKISNAQYNKTDKKIYFYSGATTETPVSNIDATDFIKDGMVASVEIKDVTNSGSCLVITFNVDAGKEDIVIPVSKIFNSNNYYLKSETSGKTEISTALNLKANTSDLAEYYKKTETSGSTQLTTALNSKANATDLTAHTGNSTIHITSDERTKWNNASTNSHTHTNKAVLDSITAIDTELSETSNNLVVNSAITTVILANERIASSSLNDLNERKLDASAYTPTDLSDYYKKEETSGKTELNTAFGLKANASDLASHTGNTTAHVTAAERTKWNGKISTAQYNKADKKINFYSGATTETPVSSIDATDFIKDGMVSNVEIKDVASSGSCLVITFNADSGKQDINIPVSKIFNPANYYLKSETSGKTEISTALDLKANTTDLTTHTGNSTIHITTDERTKWNNAVASSHTHANKAVLDSIAAIDTELSETSNNLVVNSAITKVIEDNEKIVSASLNDLNERKLDASAYTPTDLSDYYKKEETSGKTELSTAFGLKANSTDLATKANTADLTAHTGNSTIHITSDERTKWNGKISNVQYNKTDKKIYFYSGATTETPISNIDATDFIKDGMVSNVEIKDVASSGSCLVITFNADAGKQNITIPVTKIFNPKNYYLKTETSGKTELDDAFALKANTSDLSNYYKKTETSGSTQLTTAFGLKANNADLTAHTGNNTIHITSDERTKWNNATTTLASHSGNTTVHITMDERTKWNNAVTSSHTHANKAVLDKITAIDTELSETSNNLVVNSAITKVIQDNEKISSAALNELNDKKLDASAYTPTDLSDYYKKEETSGKTELDAALKLKANASDLATKANTSDLTAHTGNSTIHITSGERTKWNGKISNVQYNKTDKKIYFYSGATSEAPMSNIDATDFVKDGMVSNVEIKDVASSGSCLVITFNADSGKQDINIPVSKIFNPANYYLKSETSGKTELDAAFGKKANASDLSNYYKKTETSGSTQLTTAFNSKANTTDLAAHTGDSTIHITVDERTKWNNAVASSHTHANKDVLDKITSIDTELSETSNNLVVNSAITKIIVANEKISSSALNELNDRKLDASAYTPTDLSDYYKKGETSGNTEIANALGLKADTSVLSGYYKKTETSGSTQLTTAFNSKADTSALTTHTGNSAIHITADERTKWNNTATTLASHTGNTTAHITSDERTKWNGKVSNVQYSKTDKKIYFYSGATTETPISNIDATDFIKDGMVSNVEIKDVTNSGSCLVITFNADAGKQDITIPVTKIFNPANYYLKTETSGKTELDTAFGKKANASDLTAHTGNSTVHITADERTKWNNAATNSHTHSNKAVLDTITAIDKELSETSNNLVVNSAITKVIVANEKISSSALNELNDRKLDASAYTPTDLSDYYKKEETSGSTQLTTALGLKANTADLTAHIGNTTVHITSAERTKWNNAVTNSHTHSNKAVLDKITAIDTELSETSNNLVVSSAITKAIQDNEEAISASLNDLNKRKLDASAYTPTDLSGYYKKTETSGKTEIATALNSKANTGHTHLSSAITDRVTGITESNSGSTSVPTVSAVMQVFKDNEETISSALNDLNDRIKQLDALIKKYDTRITALENK